MDKKELQKAQNIIDALFYNDKALTQWQHELLENVILIAQTKLRQPDVSGRSKQLICNTCKSGLIDYPDINRRTCRCGGLGYNVTD